MFRFKKCSTLTIILITANILAVHFLSQLYYSNERSESKDSEVPAENEEKIKQSTKILNPTITIVTPNQLLSHTETTTHNNTEEIKDPINLQCSSSYGLKSKAQSDINMADVYQYNITDFDNPDNNGNWQYRWKIDIDKKRFTVEDNLKVILMPHVHVDPGWLFTFRQYYNQSVKDILDLMLTRLSKDRKLKFIWAEISLFDLWWNDISRHQKLRVQRLVQNNQIEFLTGGWVMPDEANTHYHAIIIQQFEGHQWLKSHLNYYPRNGWSIDPFGLSPTMAYILVRSGFNNMFIQRTHYLVKKYLGNNQQLEFIWRQHWDEKGTTDIVAKMAPFKFYTTASTCGPNEQICKSFDYKDRKSMWHTGVSVTPGNIESRLAGLVDQYKKKAMLGKSNTILVPLGGDFTWNTNEEWDDMVTNYKKIIKHVNSHQELQTQINFGTLEDYFTQLRSDFKEKRLSMSTLTGDFFTYAHENQHYWSGYFTSRPFHKSLERQLLTEIRSGHLVYTFMTAELNKRIPNVEQVAFLNNLYGRLRKARRILSLFQHHDAITGTSKDFVMDDHENMMRSAIEDCKYVLQHCFKLLTHIKTLQFEKLQIETEAHLMSQIPVDYEPVLSRRGTMSLPLDSWNTLIVMNSFNPQAVVTVFNSLTVQRKSLLTLSLQLPLDANGVQVTNLNGKLIDSELFPVFKDEIIETNSFMLHFVADLVPLSLKSFIIKIKPANLPRLKKPKVIYYTVEKREVQEHEKFTISRSDILHEGPSISNPHMKIQCDHYGFVKTVTVNGKEHPLMIGLYKYGTREDSGSPSGLYLFHPDGPAQLLPITEEPIIKVVKGSLLSYIEISHPLFTQRITLYNQGLESHAVEIKTLMDLRSKIRKNLDIVMRFKSHINSGNLSYTDLNAFQMIQRKRFDSMPLQGHFYPMPSATYIEDSSLRMTILGAHPVATASLESGHIEVGLDRTLTDDDNLGVGQGSGVNIPTISTFKILLESPSCQDIESVNKAPMLTLAGHLTLNNLLHPMQVLRVIPSDTESNTENDPLSQLTDYKPPVALNVPCDVELLDAIPLAYQDKWDDNNTTPKVEAAVFLHRVGFDSRFIGDIPLSFCNYEKENLGRVNLNNIFGQMLEPSMKQMSLSFLHEIANVDSQEFVTMNPMEVYTFGVKFQSINITKPIYAFADALRL